MWTSRLALWGKKTTERRPPCLRPDSSQRTDVGTALWAQPGGASGGGVGAPRAPPTQRVRARATAQSAGRPRGSAWAAAGRTADGRAWHRFSERWPWLTPFLLAPALEWPGPFFTLTFSLMVFEKCRGEDAEERLGVGGASALALQRVTPAPGTRQAPGAARFPSRERGLCPNRSAVSGAVAKAVRSCACSAHVKRPWSRQPWRSCDVCRRVATSTSIRQAE